MLSTINRPMAGAAVTLNRGHAGHPDDGKVPYPRRAATGATDEPHGQNGGQSGAGQRTYTGGEQTLDRERVDSGRGQDRTLSPNPPKGCVGAGYAREEKRG